MKTISILGLGAFGQLMAKHLKPHFQIKAFDPSPSVAAFASEQSIPLVTIAEAAQADIIIVATPVEKMRDAVLAIKPHLKPGTVMMDVGSVKMMPAGILQQELPADVEIICTHPLFGPQSARNGIKGLKIAVCPVRGKCVDEVVKFLRDTLLLEVIVTTPEDHDREIAAVQGLTHMIAKVLVEMEPLPKKLTTVSFDLIMQAIEMVRYDSIELFLAIERDNPFSAELRRSFFSKADDLRKYLESTEH